MKQLLTAVTLSILLFASSAWAETITVCTYGGSYTKAMEEAFAKPFTAATGIEVVFVSFPNFAKMKAQVESGNVEWDVVEPSINDYVLGVHDGLFEKLDLSGVPAGDFVKGGVQPYGVATIYYSHNPCYRTDVWKAGKGPKSWADVWNVKEFPGPRAMKYTAYSNLEAALLADGVPADKIYPLDLDRAFKKLDELKSHIKVFWKNGSQAQQVMIAHEADTGSFPAGRMLTLEKDVPVNIEWNGSIVDLDYLAILKGSTHKEAAMKFITFTSDPKRQAVLAKATYYGPANLKAYGYIDESLAKQMPSYPANMKNAVVINGEWYREHGKEVTARWEAWKMQ